MKKGLEGKPIVPLFASMLIAAALTGALSAFGGVEGADAELSWMSRILDSGMCRVIIFTGFVGFFYGLLELWGSAMEKSGKISSAAWISGRQNEEIAINEWLARQSQRVSPINYIIFALPLLGFIGTVVGISGAIGGLGGMFQGEDRNDAFVGVLSELQFAFDTTFVGLAGVLPVALCLVLIRNANSAVEARYQA